MTKLRHDDEKGWVFHDGEPRWRATQAAVARLDGQTATWLATNHARVAHLSSGLPVATIRHVPAHRRWIARIEGYSFWGDNRVLGHALYMDPVGFDRIADARAFVETVLRQSGVTMDGARARPA